MPTATFQMSGWWKVGILSEITIDVFLSAWKAAKLSLSSYTVWWQELIWNIYFFVLTFITLLKIQLVPVNQVHFNGKKLVFFSMGKNKEFFLGSFNVYIIWFILFSLFVLFFFNSYFVLFLNVFILIIVEISTWFLL